MGTMLGSEPNMALSVLYVLGRWEAGRTGEGWARSAGLGRGWGTRWAAAAAGGAAAKSAQCADPPVAPKTSPKGREKEA